MNRVNHIINGSHGRDHLWNRVVPDLNAETVKDLVCKTMISGKEVGERAKELLWQFLCYADYNQTTGKAVHTLKAGANRSVPFHR